MEEFLRSNYIILSLSIEGLAAIIAIFCYRKYKLTVAKFFLYFLVYIFICELLSGYTRQIIEGPLHFLEGTIIEKNYWWTTLFWNIGSVLFFSFFYHNLVEKDKFKKLIKWMCIGFLVLAVFIISTNFNKYFQGMFPSLLIAGGLVVLTCVCLYFYELLQSDKILNFYKSIYFYISTTIFVWWLITTPIIFYDVYFTTADWNFIILKWQIFLFANMFMYLTFSFALLWCKPETH
ncbi:hypothetical protein SAMN04487989_102160 [Bizionia echini]|uniref:Bacteriorhodopsin-like protein n=1 Tax=Bizionia echini TaxID=649333 RepID=A0A1I5AME3_9FLAO|nr:hypothetical protein [Bizionia echini]SFN63641.1 hypothetical protein SAMN04487989_102160 [Bizionia echini]